MPTLYENILKAKHAKKTDTEIADELVRRDPAWADKITAAREAGQNDRAIVREIINRESPYAAQTRASAAPETWGQAFREGAGKGMVDVVRGLGQLTPWGLERSEVDEIRQRDAALTNTKGSGWGQFAGGATIAAPTMFIPGANTALGSTAIGGALGFAQPVGTDDHRLVNTGVGAGGGLVGYGVAKATSAGARNLLDFYQTRKALKGLGIDASVSDVRQLAKAARRDNISPAEALRQLSELGPEGALADLHGKNVLRLSRAVAESPGPGADISAKFLNTRQEGQVGRVTEGINKALGAGDLFHQNVDDLTKARSVDSSPYYQSSVRAGNLVPAKEFATLKNDRFIMEQIAKVKSDPLYKFGALSDRSMPVLDQTKKAIDRLAEAAERGNNPYNYEAKLLRAASRKIRDTADSAYPDYALAREKFAEPSELLNALETGRDFFTPDAEVTKAAMKKLNPGTDQFFRIGAARAMRDRVLGAPDTADAVKRVFNTPLMREKVAAVVPDYAMAPLEHLMRREGKMFQTRSNVLSGSRTAPLLTDIAEVADNAGILRDLFRGQFGAAGVGLLRKLSNKKLSDRESKALAQLLFSSGDTARRIAPLLAQGVPGFLGQRLPQLGGLLGTSATQP